MNSARSFSEGDILVYNSREHGRYFTNEQLRGTNYNRNERIIRKVDSNIVDDTRKRNQRINTIPNIQSYNHKNQITHKQGYGAHHKLRRKLIRVKRRIFVTLIILTAFIFGIMLGTNLVTTKASESNNADPRIKYTKSVFIEPGDSLWSIAQEYISYEYRDIHEYIKELKELNQLKSNQLNAGAYICVPYYENEKSVQNGAVNYK